MTDRDIILLAGEYIELKEKYDKHQSGPLRDQMNAKWKMLTAEVKAVTGKRDPQQVLFEAK